MNRNNYHLKPKSSTIYTPPEVSQFIFELLKDKIEKRGRVLDPYFGRGSLLRPWSQFDYKTLGVDNDSDLDYGENRAIFDFLSVSKHSLEKEYNPVLILCNPPFNGYGHKLGSEVWLDKIIDLFGKEVPIVLFAPVGFCLNMTLQSKRLEKFKDGTYPPIVSRITLPKNIFPGVVFHSEILIFNVKGLEPHYFYQEEKHE